MKTLTLRIPDALAAEIEAEARATGMSKSDVARRRLERGRNGDGEGPRPLSFWDVTRDLIEPLEREAAGEPMTDVASNKKYYLRKWGFGKNKRRP